MKPSKSSQTMEIDEFTDRFFEMELEDNLFFRFDQVGEPLWDVVRFEVFMALFDHLTKERSPGPVLTPVPKDPALTRIRSSAKKLTAVGADWLRLKRLRGADFIAFIASRYKDNSGNCIDHASHDAVQVLGSMGSVQMIESQPWVRRGVNITPSTTILTRFMRLPPRHRDRVLALRCAVVEAQKTQYGEADPRLPQVVDYAYRSYLAQRQTWAEILDRTRPRGILMTQNGIQKGLIYEARRRRIPVIECQHGVINLMHPNYSYPPSLCSGDHLSLPNALLLFSEYWAPQCRLPGVRTVPVGNTSFCSNGIRSSRKGPAIFVSAGVFHPYLSPVAAEIAQLMPDQKFLVKLHPSQLSERSAIEGEYRDIPNISVIATEKSMRDLLVDASDVIIIQSTAAYEALDRGIPVHVLKRPGHRSHADLFTRPDVHLVSNAQELQTVLFRPSAQADPQSIYFRPFSREMFRAALREIGIHDSPIAQH